MNLREMIDKSARLGILNELYTSLLADQPQRVIAVADTNEIQDLGHILSLISPLELLITNSLYQREKKDFAVLSYDKELVLQVSPDGRLINNMLFDAPLTERDYAYLETLFRSIDEYIGVATLEIA